MTIDATQSPQIKKKEKGQKVDQTTGAANEMSFMEQVEQTIQNVLTAHGYDIENVDNTVATKHKGYQKHRTNVNDLPPSDREAVLIARCLQGRLASARKNGICDRCWLDQSSCFCQQCPPVDLYQFQQNQHSVETNKRSQPQQSTEQRGIFASPTKSTSRLNRIFLVMHYREIFMGVDTAKLILAAFPKSTRLVISGIPAKYQASMAELDEVKTTGQCLVLFPDDAAKTFAEYNTVSDQQQQQQQKQKLDDDKIIADTGWDIVVIDGTWQQARRIKLRYFDSNFPTVKLSTKALALLNTPTTTAESQNDNNENCREPTLHNQLLPGYQLRKHSIPWKKIATFEAVRLFLVDALLRGDDEEEDDVADDFGNDHSNAPWILVKDYVQIANTAALNRNRGNPTN